MNIFVFFRNNGYLLQSDIEQVDESDASFDSQAKECLSKSERKRRVTVKIQPIA